VIQEPVGAGELAVEAHLVVLETFAIRVGRNRFGADKIGPVAVGGNLFCAGGYGRVLYGRMQRRVLEGSCGVYVRGSKESASPMSRRQGSRHACENSAFTSGM